MIFFVEFIVRKATPSTYSFDIQFCLSIRSGKVLVDGEDISTLGLNKLRSRITIIPQVIIYRDLIYRDKTMADKLMYIPNDDT